MLEYELKRMVNNDIEYCKKEWDNYSFDWERMGRLFDKMIHKYINIIDGFDKDLKVISAYEKKNNSGDTYRDNLRLIISRLEAFRDNGYKNEGLLKENSKGFNIRPYDRTEFDSVRLTMDRCEKIGKKEKEEISQKLDEIETVCTSAAEPTEKWNRLRPYVVWLSGKSLNIASYILPLLNMIG